MCSNVTVPFINICTIYFRQCQIIARMLVTDGGLDNVVLDAEEVGGGCNMISWRPVT